MSTLKERFENYAPSPDPEVWEAIEASLRHRVVRRRWLTATTAVVAGAGAFAVLFAMNNNDTTSVAVAQRSDVVAVEGNEATPAPPTVDVDAGQNLPVLRQVTPSSVMTCDFASSPDGEGVVENDISATETETVREVAVPSAAVAEIPVAEPHNAVQEAPEKAQPVQATPQKEESIPQIQEPQRRINPKVVTPSELVVWIPNAFSPDDPVEEAARTFKVFPNDGANILSFEIFIYSRSGRLVYHSKDYNEGWNGISNGHPQPMGTYVYIIEINDAVKGLQHTKGSVTLIR